MAGDFIWYELMTPDPAGAAAFYNAVVGWTIPATGDAMPNGSNYRLIGRPDGGAAGGVLELTPPMLDHGARPLWIAYLHAPDIEATIGKAVAMGATVQMGLQELPAGKMAMLGDPGGAPFYLMDPTPPEGQPDAKSDVYSEIATHRCGWNELAAPDEQVALKFYGDLLGWESTDGMDMGPQGTYHFITNNGTRLGAIYRHGSGEPGWRFYFRVPDIAAAVELVERHGGTITDGPHDVPGGDKVIMGTDPQGANFALVGAVK
jgi:hypothetical protein